MEQEDTSTTIATVPERRTQRKTLAAQDGLVIELVTCLASNKSLAICFYPLLMHGKPEFVVDEKYFLSRAYDILIVHGIQDQEDFEQTTALIKPLVERLSDYRNIVAVGVHEGASAALSICGPLPRIKILGFSPLLESEKYRSLAPVDVVDAKIILDRQSEGRTADIIEIMTRFPGANVITLPYSGNPSWFSAIETGVFEAELRAFASLSPNNVIKVYRRGRTNSSLYLSHLGSSALSSGKFAFSAKVLGLAFAIDPNPHVATLYARSIAEGGSPIEAITILDPIVERNPENAHLVAMQAYFSELGLQDDNALRYIRKAISILPTYNDFLIYERRLLSRLYDELVLRHGMTVMLLKKRSAERDLESGDRPDNAHPKAFLAYLAATLLVVVLVALVARAANLS